MNITKYDMLIFLCTKLGYRKTTESEKMNILGVSDLTQIDDDFIPIMIHTKKSDDIIFCDSIENIIKQNFNDLCEKYKMESNDYNPKNLKSFYDLLKKSEKNHGS